MSISKESRMSSELQRIFKKQGLSSEAIRLFRRIIKQHYKIHGRDLPWRNTQDPYHVLVAEVMLQQTQVERVINKYNEFISAFPDIRSLSKASVKRVLSVWQGMGYNRRALALKATGQRLIKEYNCMVPSSPVELVKLPGIGTATASSIAAFAYNKPTVFIETNIRTVFIHFFFQAKKNVLDHDIIDLVEETLDRKNPGAWYNALMDYGVMLKKTTGNAGRRSAHYKRQSPFHGSDRQIRGAILRVLNEGPASKDGLRKKLEEDPERLGRLLEQLQREGFILKKGRVYSIP